MGQSEDDGGKGGIRTVILILALREEGEKQNHCILTPDPSSSRFGWKAHTNKRLFEWSQVQASGNETTNSLWRKTVSQALNIPR